MSPGSMSLPGLFFVSVDSSCPSDQLRSGHAPAVVGRLNDGVSLMPVAAIASRNTQQTNAAHHGQPCFGSRVVAALYSFTRGPQFVPLVSATPISAVASST